VLNNLKIICVRELPRPKLREIFLEIIARRVHKISIFNILKLILVQGMQYIWHSLITLATLVNLTVSLSPPLCHLQCYQMDLTMVIGIRSILFLLYHSVIGLLSSRPYYLCYTNKMLTGLKSFNYPDLQENVAFFYLQKVLKIHDKIMTRIVLKHSWILYLRVESNLKPTVAVLHSFGFRDDDIRKLVEVTPSILGLNHEWSIPEKLLSIEKMFYLSKPSQLVKVKRDFLEDELWLIVHSRNQQVVTSQPYLLTSSVERNLVISKFLLTDIGFSPEQLRRIVINHPSVTMLNINKLNAYWSVLTVVYGFSELEARQLIIKYPRILSRELLKGGEKTLYIR